MIRLKNIRTFSAYALLSTVATASAADLKVTSGNGDVLAIYDLSAIEELGLREIRTTTPWTDGVVRFEGASLQTILIDAGVAGRNVVGLSMDDYAARISSDMIEEYDPIVATRMNGAVIQARDNGPFWIMFDFDDMGSRKSDEMRSYSVSHLNELEVE